MLEQSGLIWPLQGQRLPHSIKVGQMSSKASNLRGHVHTKCRLVYGADGEKIRKLV